VPHLLRLEAHHAPEGLITAQQSWQRVHALDPQQGLQVVEQERLEAGDHLALDGRALDLTQPVDHPKRRQKGAEVIQQGPVIHLVDAIDYWLPVQTPGYP
jgi:hypothetical protein